MRRRRLAPIEVETRALDLPPADRGLRLLEPPPVAVAGVTVAPVVETARLPLTDPEVPIEAPWIAPFVDIVPMALAHTLFAERTREVRLAPARVESMPLVTARIESPSMHPGPAVVEATHPDRLARMFRRATPPERLAPEHVKECVTRLYRQSGLSSPAGLALVGIFERVPGGAVHAVAPHPHGVVLRLDWRAKARPATLVVGKRRRDGALLTVEVEPGAVAGSDP